MHGVICVIKYGLTHTYQPSKTAQFGRFIAGKKAQNQARKQTSASADFLW